MDGRPSGLPSGVFAWAAPRGLQRSSSIVLPSWSGGSDRLSRPVVARFHSTIRRSDRGSSRIAESARGHLEAEPGKPRGPREVNRARATRRPARYPRESPPQH